MNGHQNETCYDESDLYGQIIDIILSSNVGKFKGTM